MAKKRTIRNIPQQRTAMREQPAQERVRNFSEVACGYRVEEALNESLRARERGLLLADSGHLAGETDSVAGHVRLELANVGSH